VAEIASLSLAMTSEVENTTTSEEAAEIASLSLAMTSEVENAMTSNDVELS